MFLSKKLEMVPKHFFVIPVLLLKLYLGSLLASAFSTDVVSVFAISFSASLIWIWLSFMSLPSSSFKSMFCSSFCVGIVAFDATSVAGCSSSLFSLAMALTLLLLLSRSATLFSSIDDVSAAVAAAS